MDTLPNQYSLENLTPGQEIPEEVYSYYLNAATPIRLPRKTLWRAWQRHGIATETGYLMGQARRSENGRALYPAFGRSSRANGEAFYYLGLSGETARSWRALIRSWPETAEEQAARYRKIDELRAKGWTDSDLADYYDMHPHYDPKGYGICAECGAVISESRADREIYGYEDPDSWQDIPDDPEDPET